MITASCSYPGSYSQTLGAHNLCKDISDSHCMICKLPVISLSFGIGLVLSVYGSQAHPHTTFDPTTFGECITHTLLQMDHDSLHVLYLLETLCKYIHTRAIIRSQQDAGSILSFSNQFEIHCRPEEILPKEILSLRCPCQMMEESIY